MKCRCTLATDPLLNYQCTFYCVILCTVYPTKNSSTTGLCAVSSLEPQVEVPIKEITDLPRVNQFTPLPLPCLHHPGPEPGLVKELWFARLRRLHGQNNVWAWWKISVSAGT